MKTRVVIFAVVLVALGALVFWSGMDFKAKKVTPPLVASSPPMTSESAAPLPNLPLPKVSSVTVTAQDDSGRSYPEVELKPGVAAPLPGSGLALRFNDFYTQWNWSGGPQNVSYNSDNPAAKIEVLKNGKTLYYAWAFQNVPFFRMGHHAMQSGGADAPSGQLAFTLNGYEGLETPGGAGK